MIAGVVDQVKARSLCRGDGEAVVHPDDSGVDRTLIRYTLSLTPTERLRNLENAMNTLASVRVVRRATTGTARRR